MCALRYDANGLLLRTKVLQRPLSTTMTDGKFFTATRRQMISSGYVWGVILVPERPSWRSELTNVDTIVESGY